MLESSMNAQFNQRFAQDLEAASRGIIKKGGTKRLSKVWERIGRLKEKYPSVHKYYDISIQDNGKGLAIGMTYQKNQVPVKPQGQGCLSCAFRWIPKMHVRFGLSITL
jgi:hypothetical protein